MVHGVVNAAEAARVRAIFRLYLELGALLPLVAELKTRDWRNKATVSRKWGACARCTRAASLSELHTLGALKSGRGLGGREAGAAPQMEIG